VDLQRASCLITGCSSGIGHALARALAREGAAVFATARRLEAIAGLRKGGIRILELDVADRNQVEQALSAAGSVDVLVNNAGYGLEGAIEEVADDELIEQYEANVFGPWRLIRAVLPGMRERGSGAIVNISSFGGVVPYPGIGAYRTSKFAMEGLSWTLHLEVAHFGIRVLDVQPGLTETAFGSNMKKARAMGPASPYAEMHACAARAYPNMSPVAMPPERVADAVVAELRKDSGPLRLRVGADAERVTGILRDGDEAYERFLVDELGFGWHPLETLDGGR
jgi:NAD(P)-dependent dehydrogenase (short-subunit alcohol dehydrogenase family)